MLKARGRYYLDGNWKLVLFYLFFMPLMLSLGFWQLDRANQKNEMQDIYERASRLEPIPLQNLALDEDANYRRVLLSGRFDERKAFFLDNRVFRGQVGYDVIMPYFLDQPIMGNIEGEQRDFHYLFVNRGWIEQGPSREELPSIPHARQASDIEVILLPDVGRPFVLSETPMHGEWPELIQYIDFHEMGRRVTSEQLYLNYPLLGRLTVNSNGVLGGEWRAVNYDPNKHLGYAFQWFSMAGALTILFLFVSIKREQ